SLRLLWRRDLPQVFWEEPAPYRRRRAGREPGREAQQWGAYMRSMVIRILFASTPNGGIAFRLESRFRYTYPSGTTPNYWSGAQGCAFHYPSAGSRPDAPIRNTN